MSVRRALAGAVLGLAVLTGCNHSLAHALRTHQHVPATTPVSAPAPSPKPTTPAAGAHLSAVAKDLSQLDRASAQVDGDLASASSAEQSGG